VRLNGVVNQVRRRFGFGYWSLAALRPTRSPGPSDVVIQNRTGVLHEDLHRATLEALKLGGKGCLAHARRYSWRRSLP
jgi:hypothetical protein